MGPRIPDKLYFKIGEVSRLTKVEPYVLRYWESEFKMVNPQKSRSNQRVYRRRDIELILEIKRLLYKEGYTLEGAKRRLRAIQRQRDKQLELNLQGEKGRYLKGLKTIKDGLHSIRRLLG